VTMNPDFALAGALLALLAAVHWRTALVVFGVGLIAYTLHSQLGYF
jgi:hypothetical protein